MLLKCTSSDSAAQHPGTADDSCETLSQAQEQSKRPNISSSPNVPRSSSTAEDIGLELQQLPHEGQVGGNDMTPLLYEVKGLIQFDTLCMHQVSQTDGGRAGNTCLTVDQHPTSALLHRVCNRRQDGEKGSVEYQSVHISFEI